MKFCKDCETCERLSNGKVQCTNKKARKFCDIVTGAYPSAWNMRETVFKDDSNICGPDGKWFKPIKRDSFRDRVIEKSNG